MIINPVENHSIMVMQVLGQRVGSWFKVILISSVRVGRQQTALTDLIKYLKPLDFSLDRLTGKALGTFAKPTFSPCINNSASSRQKNFDGS
jgi:hypothetical protein